MLDSVLSAAPLVFAAYRIGMFIAPGHAWKHLGMLLSSGSRAGRNRIVSIPDHRFCLEVLFTRVASGVRDLQEAEPQWAEAAADIVMSTGSATENLGAMSALAIVLECGVGA